MVPHFHDDSDVFQKYSELCGWGSRFHCVTASRGKALHIHSTYSGQGNVLDLRNVRLQYMRTLIHFKHTLGFVRGFFCRHTGVHINNVSNTQCLYDDAVNAQSWRL